MKILYVVQNVTHPSIRGELRHYHFLRCLARDHDITLLAMRGSGVTEPALDELRQSTRRIVLVGPKAPPRPTRRGPMGGLALARWRLDKVRRFNQGLHDMKERIEQLVSAGRFDLMLVAGSDLHALLDGFTDVPMVVDWCDAASLRFRLALRHTSMLEWPWRLFRYQQERRIEARVLRKLSHVTFISRRDRDAARSSSEQATIIPNGCDLTYWTRRHRSPGSRIVFTGVMDYPPNADAARYLLTRIAPLVRRQIPELEVVIAGRNPSRDILEMARTQPGVIVTGSVPDLRPFIESAAVFVAPLRFASGMQNKILEAMAMELPVVTTPVVAGGIRMDGEEEPPLRVGESPGDLAAHIAALLRDSHTARRLGVAGRRYVQSHCDWERSAAMLDRVCRQAAHGTSAPEIPRFDSGEGDSVRAGGSQHYVLPTLV